MKGATCGFFDHSNSLPDSHSCRVCVAGASLRSRLSGLHTSNPRNILEEGAAVVPGSVRRLHRGASTITSSTASVFLRSTWAETRVCHPPRCAGRPSRFTESPDNLLKPFVCGWKAGRRPRQHWDRCPSLNGSPSRSLLAGGRSRLRKLVRSSLEPLEKNVTKKAELAAELAKTAEFSWFSSLYFSAISANAGRSIASLFCTA